MAFGPVGGPCGGLGNVDRGTSGGGPNYLGPWGKTLQHPVSVQRRNPVGEPAGLAEYLSLAMNSFLTWCNKDFTSCLKDEFENFIAMFPSNSQKKAKKKKKGKAV